MGSAVSAWVMPLYSLALALAAVLGAPYWLYGLARRGRFRAGLPERLGRVPPALRAAAAGRRVVWVHAVSVGEVLAATRLVAELEAGLQAGGGPEWLVCVSATTATGQALARQRFGAARVFAYPLDFAFAVRPYLRALQPAALVLMESELWPRMLHECRRARVPVAVANARVSDRSYARGVRLRRVWGHVLRQVTLFLAQSEEDARRLVAMGAAPAAVQAIGNLKYDVRAAGQSRVTGLIRDAAAGRPIVVAGSTVADRPAQQRTTQDEEAAVIRAWAARPRRQCRALLVLTPRHPERFALAESLAAEFPYARVSTSGSGPLQTAEGLPPEIVLLDTIGDLAAVYGIADAAFVGGSLVARGGHNPLEPAQWGVPVVMGPSYQNFRAVVEAMLAADALRIVQDEAALEAALTHLLTDPQSARALGERGRQVYQQQGGATGRAVAALLALVQP